MKQSLILAALTSFRGERSAKASFHLLNGKRTIQTVQDGTFFNNLFLFGTLPQLTVEQFEQSLENLKHEQLIYEKDRLCLQTEKAKRETEAFLAKHPYLYSLKGWQYGKVERHFWERFALLVQSISYLHDQQSFAPTTFNIWSQQWVRNILKRHLHDLAALRQQLYQECESLLTEVEDLDANLFVQQLSRPGKIGLTKAQISKEMGLDKREVQLRTKGLIHLFCQSGYQEPHRYPVLATCFDSEEINLLTLTASKTANLYKQHQNLDVIAKIRRLKRSTIEDHIVEMAMMDRTFSIAPFVDESLQAQVGVIVANQQVRLKAIRDQLDDGVSYFQIRLILAKREGDKHVRA
ncbi:helix-turn-helix domain-containing protein [Shouchella sp. 1P09AA]|uniref:helix-turn-helix domain-containing protein n=1 Tax=unclassified Shouchella TaxID=2893065 RepID=UPI0039A2A83F